mmetsp:Transcript_18496/g.18757  ORF Transcript_18496/g.18757 Transcript_18496/m.18757 type:complete len:101 (-) Transcript_18496:671-973(-)
MIASDKEHPDQCRSKILCQRSGMQILEHAFVIYMVPEQKLAFLLFAGLVLWSNSIKTVGCSLESSIDLLDLQRTISINSIRVDDAKIPNMASCLIHNGTV